MSNNFSFTLRNEPVWLSVRQRVGAHLELVKLGTLRSAALVVEDGARACCGPQTFALPAGVWIVDAPIHVFAEKAHWVRDVNVYKFAVHESQKSLVAVGFRDGHVCAKTQRVEAIHPDEIGMVGAAGIGHAFELRAWELIQRPTFGAEFAGGRGRPVQRSFAFAAVEAGEMAAGKRGPH